MTVLPISKDKILVRGDTRSYLFTLKERQTNPDKEPDRLDLTGSLVTFTMKLTDPRGAVGFQNQKPDVVKTSDDTLEIILLDQGELLTKGQARIFLVHADTRFLPPGVYAYDVQVVTAQGSVITAASGRILLRSRPTEAEDLT